MEKVQKLNEKEELLDKFKVEELEHRFEMGQWIGSVNVGVKYGKLEYWQEWQIKQSLVVK